MILVITESSLKASSAIVLTVPGIFGVELLGIEQRSVVFPLLKKRSSSYEICSFDSDTVTLLNDVQSLNVVPDMVVIVDDNVRLEREVSPVNNVVGIVDGPSSIITVLSSDSDEIELNDELVSGSPIFVVPMRVTLETGLSVNASVEM